jgi:hypothetical protein
MSKCTQCGYELAAGAKFCPECGAKQELKCASCGVSLTPGAKFCPECGAKADAAKVGAGGTAAEVSSITLAPIPLDLADCPVSIKEVTAEGPNDDGELSITVKYEVTNDTDDDWEYLEVRIQLLSAAGQIVEESRDTQEQTISAGDNAELESSFWGVKAKALGNNPEKAHVVVSVIASGFGQEKLGEIAIPETPFETVALKPVKIGEALQLISGSLWKTEPDDDKECRVEIKALVQNLTDKHLPEVKIVAEVTDKTGRELTDAGGQDEVRPGNVVIINGSGYAKEKKFAGAKADLSLRVYWPVAAGASQRQGMAVAAAESSESGSSSWPFPTGDDAADRNANVSEGLSINGGWEGTKCRWFVAWKVVSETEIAGAVAGYSGGGTFQVERFYARHSDDVLEALWIDITDRVSEEEIDFETLDQEILQVCEQCLDCIWEWNDRDEWSDSDRVVLRAEKTDELESDGDMLLLATEASSFVRDICEAAGLTTAPSNPS